MAGNNMINHLGICCILFIRILGINAASVSTKECALENCARCFPGNPNRCLVDKKASFIVFFLPGFFGGLILTYIFVSFFTNLGKK